MTKTVLAAGLLLLLVIVFVVPPESLPLSTCAFHSLTGHSCLTCGMTRSLHAMAHGELTASMRYHMFGPAIFLGIVLLSLLLAVEAMTGKRVELPAKGSRKQAAVLFTITWLMYWGARLISEFVA